MGFLCRSRRFGSSCFRQTDTASTFGGVTFTTGSWAIYYDPSRGHWLEKDPIGFAGGMNAYSYCAAQPVGSVDANGFQAVQSGGGVMQSLIDSINGAAGLGAAGSAGLGVMGSAGLLARCGWVGVAAGVGYGIGWGVGHIPAVDRWQRGWGNRIGGDRDYLPASNTKGPNIHYDEAEDFYRIYPLENSSGHTKDECDKIYEAVLRKLNRLYNKGSKRVTRYDYSRLRRELDAWYANCLAGR